jgi:DNA (cytosine-5)-methyltransferase 1
VDNTEKLPTVLSFCSGYGGIERGLDLSGLEHRVIAYVEIEAYAIANLVAKMETGQLPPCPIYSDIKTFPAHLFRGKVDIITGGYPCQPFSLSGNRKGADDPRHLWPHIRRHIESIRPVQCFLENVEGHISLGLCTVVSDLEQDGYRTTWGLFSANEVGAPHKRKRVFILGNANNTYVERGRLPGRVRKKHTDTDSASNSIRKQAAQQWLPEPKLGRVVNGGANRVDRLRLLGNGVVPQTAAKAWYILNNRHLGE